MSLSDCPKCWDTPCTCGHGYKDWTVAALSDHIKMLTAILSDKLAVQHGIGKPKEAP